MAVIEELETAGQIIGEDIPSLPEGWDRETIGKLFIVNPAKPANDVLPPDAAVTFVPMPAVDAEAGAITSPQERPFSSVRKGYTSFAEGNVIMAKITPCMENGKAAIAKNLTNGFGFGSTEFHVFRATGTVLPEYLYHFIRQESYRRLAESEMTGSVGQRRVPSDFIEDTLLPVPPLAEQKRIVAKVEHLLAQVNAAKERLSKVPAILKAFRQSVLSAACSGKLAEDWRGEHLNKARDLLDALQKLKKHRKEVLGRRLKEAALPDTDELPQIPDSWVWSTIGEIAAPELRAITDGPFGSNLKSEHYTSTGPRVIRLQNIGDGVFVDNIACISDAHFSTLSKHRVCQGDVVIAALGNPLPRACVVPSTLGPAIVKADCIRFKPADGVCLSTYINLAINTDFIRRHAASSVHGVSRPRLNLSEIQSIPVPLPPFEEQKEIVRKVESLFALADSIEKRLSAATLQVEKITQAVLSKAFSGELVPTEAELARKEGRDYEPANVLLERIRREREAQAPKRKSGSRKRG